MGEHDGPLVVFKSVPDFYIVERNGNKPNTLRSLDAAEYSQELDFPRACLMAGEPASICIVNAADTVECFFRRITDISQVGSLVGKTLWCISWLHEDGLGTYRDPEGASDE